ncbi:MAG: response regulator [Pirellulaceae bacterium]
MQSESFDFFLDTAADDSCSAAAVLQPVASGEDLGPRNVLLLEDDPAQLYLLEQHLDSVGLTVRSANSVGEARSQLAENAFELAILDAHLPDGSGLEFCKEIDSDPRHVGLPVVVLSSCTESKMVRQTRASGGSFFLSKPYDPNVLLTVIEKALGRELG